MVKKILTPLDRLRSICVALPEVTERLSHGAPTWSVRGKASFVTYWGDGHHEDQFPHLWCAAPPGGQQELVDTEPARFFRPPYVGGRGWIGVRLDECLGHDAEWSLRLQRRYAGDALSGRGHRRRSREV